MRTFRAGEVVVVDHTGRSVTVLEVVPVGLKVFYRVEDEADGQVWLAHARQLRPSQGAS